MGGAIGDALGMPLEQLPETKIRERFDTPIYEFLDATEGAPCYEFGLKRGMYTDDTQAVRVSARAIAENNALTPRLIADALSGWLFGNALDQAPRYPGVTTVTAMQRYNNTGDPTRSGVPSKGCGAAIRISPVALWLAITNESDFTSTIETIAGITHIEQSAIDGAVIVAHLIKNILQGYVPSFDELNDLCSSDRMRGALRKAKVGTTGQSGPDLALDLGGGTGAHEVVPMALYHLYTNSFGFKKTIESGLNTFHPSGIDMDSILSIAGCISGIYAPDEVLSSVWLKDLEDAEVIATEAQALLNAALSSEDS